MLLDDHETLEGGEIRSDRILLERAVGSPRVIGEGPDRYRGWVLMRKFSALLLVCLAVAAGAIPVWGGGEEVVLLYADKSPESKSVADYYAGKTTRNAFIAFKTINSQTKVSKRLC